MSVNHQYAEFKDKVVARYRKTVPSMVAGSRLDPYDNKTRIIWLVQTPTNDWSFDENRQIRFSYDYEIIELYSEREVSIFKMDNRKIIESGVIIPTDITEKDVNLSNALTDSDITAIIESPTLAMLEKKLQNVTSVITMSRLQHAAENSDISLKYMRAIEQRSRELNEFNTTTNK